MNTTSTTRAFAASILAATALFTGCAAPLAGTDADSTTSADDPSYPVSFTHAPEAPTAHATGCMTIQRGVAGSVGDTFVDVDRPDGIYGSDDTATLDASRGDFGFVGRRMMLIRFDLASLPKDIAVRSAKMTLHTADPGPGVIHVHETRIAWSERSATYTSVQDNYEADPITSADGEATVATFELTAEVGAWVDGEKRNMGLTLVSDSENPTTYWTSEAKPELRPSLEVCFVSTR